MYMNLAWEEAEVSFFVWDTNSSSIATLAQISQMVQSSPAANSLEGGTTFVPRYATIFSWRIRQSGIEVRCVMCVQVGMCIGMLAFVYRCLLQRACVFIRVSNEQLRKFKCVIHIRVHQVICMHLHLYVNVLILLEIMVETTYVYRDYFCDIMQSHQCVICKGMLLLLCLRVKHISFHSRM